ncbi:golgin subfamily A member 6-like protein 22 [Olea europaea var. sylvestris]|uniref:golgin subfamily A member 6-like protein 22 n=1 Tax=Olea europaea var. sylvestris TaxID=158386 RepID=UPI000C1CCCCD|nr:golgin subfamily A member 6-like protein 22 [Olea europaea var. sylvestris]
MAKKKVSNSHQEKTHQKQEELVQAPQKDSIAMENEASVKLESLKSLNQRLLKEAMERRQEVESLMLSKGSLESELTGANSKMEMLRNELTQVRDKVVHLELERSVVSVFVALQLGHHAEVFEGKTKGLESKITDLSGVIEEKQRSIGLLNEKLSKTVAELESERDSSRRVIEERDGLKGKLDVKIEEANGLRTNLIELEEGKKVIEQQIEKIRDEYNRVLEEKQERERKIVVIVSDRNLLEKSLVDSNKLIEDMKKEIREIVKEKQRIEEEKTLEMVKGRELESVVSGLNEKVTNLHEEEEKLRANLAELEKKCAESVEREKDMGMEIDELMKKKKLNEKICEGLIEEKNLVEKNMNKALKQSNEQRLKIDELVDEKIELVNDKDSLASEVVSLQNKVVKFQSLVLELEVSGRDKVEKIKNLESEISGYKYEIEQMKGERDDLRMFLDEENQIAMGLKEKIEEMEKRIEESENATGKVKAENLTILKEKKELEIQCDALKKSIASLEKSLGEAQNGLDAMQGKVELADANTSLVMKMLRDTAAFCSKDERDAVEGDLLGGKQINGEEMKAHMVELEKIKNAIVIKETEVENMKRQLEFLQISVAEAHKKKSFWTILSSVTTLLAAVSIAFVAHGH